MNTQKDRRKHTKKKVNSIYLELYSNLEISSMKMYYYKI